VGEEVVDGEFRAGLAILLNGLEREARAGGTSFE
jgi:hypothetical protein